MSHGEIQANRDPKASIPIAKVFISPYFNAEETTANGALIVAAPNLLTALWNIVADTNTLMTDDNRAAACAAIREARNDDEDPPIVALARAGKLFQNGDLQNSWYEDDKGKIVNMAEVSKYMGTKLFIEFGDLTQTKSKIVVKDI